MRHTRRASPGRPGRSGRPLRRAVTGLACAGLVLVAGCGAQEQGADPAPPIEDPSAPEPVVGDGGGAFSEPPPETQDVAERDPVELREDGVAGIELPASPEEVREALTRAWGEPDVDEVTEGCPVFGADARFREIGWGDLTVTGLWKVGEDPRLNGWMLRGQQVPGAVDVPFDVVPGTPWESAVDALPGVEEGEDVRSNGGDPILRSPEVDGVLWLGDPERTEVTQVSLNRSSCD